MNASGTVLAAELEIGHHHQVTIGGFTFNVDTIWSSVVAGVIVLGAALYMARRAQSGRPSKLQLAFETMVDAVEKQVKSSMGDVAPFVVPLAMTLFLYILIANWLELIPTQGWLAAPSGDINFTLALGLFVVVWVHAAHIRQKGLRKYLSHYKHGVPVLAPFLNAIEELVKPFTLALRLFGNIFAGGVMLAIIALLPPYLLWAPNVLWKLIDFAVGAIQAFIFALLTILYFGFALEPEDEEAPAH
jgi:F-type H+-transporting ATPase subunit a